MPAPRPISGIVIREATIADAPLFPDQKLFLQRVKDGNRCFMGIEEATGRLTNYRWVNTSGPYIPELRRYLLLEPDEAYAFDLNTLPDFRRRGIDYFTRHYTYSYLHASGYSKVYAYIHGDNHPSLRAARHFLRCVCRVRYIQLRGCEPIVMRGRGGCREGFPQFSTTRPSRAADSGVLSTLAPSAPMSHADHPL